MVAQRATARGRTSRSPSSGERRSQSAATVRRRNACNLRGGGYSGGGFAMQPTIRRLFNAQQSGLILVILLLGAILTIFAGSHVERSAQCTCRGR